MPSPVGDDQLTAIAQSFYDCLRDHGIPAELRTDTAGRVTLVSFSKGHSYFWSLPDGTTEAGGGYPEELFNQRVDDQSRMAQQGEAVPYALEVDGHDFSEALRQCAESSGYSQQKVWASLPYQGRDTSYFPLIVEASNEWAACAREHGISGIKDAVLPDRLSQDYPTVLLPVTITEQELRQLLVVCPNYDVTMESHNLQLWKEWGQSHDEPGGMPDGLIFQPSIGFDYPDFDGRFTGVRQPQGPSASPPPPDVAAMLDHLGNLMYILLENEIRLAGQAQGGVDQGGQPPETGPGTAAGQSAGASPPA